MIPMLDTAIAPEFTTAVMTIGPAVVGVLVALVAGVAWLASGTSEELRRLAAREWEQGPGGSEPTERERLAA